MLGGYTNACDAVIMAALTMASYLITWSFCDTLISRLKNKLQNLSDAKIKWYIRYNSRKNKLTLLKTVCKSKRKLDKVFETNSYNLALGNV